MSAVSIRETGASPVREVAVTFDDLPAVSATRGDLAHHQAITSGLIRNLTAHGVPAVGFVNEKKLLTEGVTDPARVELLRQWLDAGLELGNHTFAHLDLHATPIERFEDDVVLGEPVTRGLLQAQGMPLRYFRHPYLRTGMETAVRRRLEGFLDGRGYRIAPATIAPDDYLFAAACDRALARGDRRVAQRVADAYVPNVVSLFEYWEGVSRRLLGYEVRQIVVLHANALNAERFDELGRALKGRGYTFVTLERALADEAYAVLDEGTHAAGISWLERWALARGHDADFLAGQPETPGFVRLQSGVGDEGRMIRWWTALRMARSGAR